MEKRNAAGIARPVPHGRRTSIHAGTKAASASSTKLRPQGCHESAFALSAGRKREGGIVYRQIWFCTGRSTRTAMVWKKFASKSQSASYGVLDQCFGNAGSPYRMIAALMNAWQVLKLPNQQMQA